MSQTTEAATRPAAGLQLHPGEERKYRERTTRSRELFAQTKQLIPTGHGGGKWYQPLSGPPGAARGAGSGMSMERVPRPAHQRLGSSWALQRRHPRRHRRAARRSLQFGSPDWDLSYSTASLLVERIPSVEGPLLVSGTETNQSRSGCACTPGA